ncbi:hypothetical protein [Serratia sp. M24T3]|uniref:hypothetical protein n=1 Tax=Serratia sp. M24T3 TaxID=932213 RepID=UPI00025BB226|nr:hypothetical protein [Serratia sp. M24T3]EIC83167.1 hypothetical protein SPM24T3_18036 [Serratia sp. M24T3]
MDDQKTMFGLKVHSISDVTFVSDFKIEFLDRTAAQVATIHANKQNQVGVKISLNMFVGDSNKEPANLAPEELLHCLCLYDVASGKELLFKAYDNSSLSYTDVKTKYCKAVNYTDSHVYQESIPYTEKARYTHTMTFYVWANDFNNFDIYARLSHLSKDFYPDTYVDTSGDVKNFPKVILAINAIQAIYYSDKSLWEVPTNLNWIDHSWLDFHWDSGSTGTSNAPCTYAPMLIRSQKYISDPRYELVDFKVKGETSKKPEGECSAWIGWKGKRYDTYGWWVEPVVRTPDPSADAIGTDYPIRLTTNNWTGINTWYTSRPKGEQLIKSSQLKGKDARGITLYVYNIQLRETDLVKRGWSDNINNAYVTVTDAFGNSGEVVIAFHDTGYTPYIV